MCDDLSHILGVNVDEKEKLLSLYEKTLIEILALCERWDPGAVSGADGSSPVTVGKVHGLARLALDTSKDVDLLSQL